MSDRESVREAIDSLPSFYGHEFGQWKDLLAERIEAAAVELFGLAQVADNDGVPTYSYNECIDAFVAALRGETHE